MSTSAAILEAARVIYLQEGLKGLSMRKVASKVGVSATAIYRHFENKEAMLAGVLAQGSHVFLHYLSRGLSGKTPHERLQLSGEGYLDFALEHPGYYRIKFMCTKQDFDMEAISEQSEADFAPTFLYLVDRVRECMEAGVIAKGNPDGVAATIWGMCHGLSSLRLADKLNVLNDQEFRTFYSEAIRSTLRGLLPMAGVDENSGDGNSRRYQSEGRRRSE